MHHIRTIRNRHWAALTAAVLLAVAPYAPAASTEAPVTLRSLLEEMASPDAVARFPQPSYQCLQASSYNRASTHRNQPKQDTSGWFADSDGTGFIRTEMMNGKTEWVIMEHAGPGCLTKMWTPFFYSDFNNRVGPNLRIYLDGSDSPVLDESLIKLVLGEGTFRPPLATPTARAGDSYAPIPFARSCKITMAQKPFYNIINYRAYPEGTAIETFTRAGYEAAATALETAGRALTAQPDASKGAIRKTARLKQGDQLEVELPAGPKALRQFTIRLPGAANHPASLRSTVLAMTFDGEDAVWCPVGDFFCSADSLHPIHTWQRTVTADGTMVCRWVMPYRQSGELRVHNFGAQAVEVDVQADVARWDWDERSMHFHANWRPDDLVPGTPFQDWNFIDIRGQGVFVGDAWTVLNFQGSWWGEGDEKIYVDDAWDKGFPTHFGTGTEDYYGWAGGKMPTRHDEFSVPFLANARVGGLDGSTIGFNICSRTRSLDAIPFTQRLVFDMESSFGTDIRNPWNLLGYSAAIFWYAKPGATHNRPALPELAARPIMALAEIETKSQAIRAPAKAASPVGAGGYEFELLKPTAMLPGLQAGPQRPDESFNPRQWSGEQHSIGPSTRARGTKTFMGLDRLVLKTPDGAQAKRPIRLFIIAGQSNAQGYNHIRQYRNGREEFPATLRAQPRILFWPGNDAPQATDNLWTTLRVGDSGSFGPEIGFASDVERLLPGSTIALVKYAVGGSGIARSADYTDYIPALAGYDDKGRNWHPPTAGREAGALYRALMANFRNAVAALERDGKPWELAGIVWMQGEHEAGISRKMAGDYEEILSGFISSVRKDLDAPSLPFVIGQINSHTWAFGDIARNCQVEVCRKDKRSLLVETVDLPRVNGDAAHFTADGMLTLGSRFAATMARLIPDLVPDGPK